MKSFLINEGCGTKYAPSRRVFTTALPLSQPVQAWACRAHPSPSRLCWGVERRARGVLGCVGTRSATRQQGLHLRGR